LGYKRLQLGERFRKQAPAPLTRNQTSANRYLMARTILELGWIRDYSMLDFIYKNLSNKNNEIKKAAYWALCRISKKNYGYNSKKWKMWIRKYKTIKKEITISNELSDDLKIIVKRLNSGDNRTRRIAAEQLMAKSKKAAPALPYLLKAAKDNYWAVRFYSVKAICKINKSKAIPVLISLIDDEKEMLRKEARYSLKKITGENHKSKEKWLEWWKRYKKK